ncbi:MAG TPA: hypothetical protein VK453_25175 [Micromonosporaceae bacterium]|nr:hypothetical protein [Micromonosporaceae bacterium]
MMTADGTFRAVPGTTWVDRAPLTLCTTTDSRGNPCPTPPDRRWLWRIESFLAVYGTNAGHHAMGADLCEYLKGTCEHHWLEYEGDADIPGHKQCWWCSDVDWNVTGTTDDEQAAS